MEKRSAGAVSSSIFGTHADDANSKMIKMVGYSISLAALALALAIIIFDREKRGSGQVGIGQSNLTFQYKALS